MMMGGRGWGGRGISFDLMGWVGMVFFFGVVGSFGSDFCDDCFCF